MAGFCVIINVFRRNLLILALLLMACLEATAQYDPSFSHYWAMETSYNPAAIGKQDKINITGAYNMTLTGFRHNPKTMYFSGDLPFYFIGGYHGVGGQCMSDQIGLFSHNRFTVQYANKQKLFGGTLSIGVEASMISENFDGGGLNLAEAGDPAFATSEVTGSGFDLGAGLYYKHKNWYAGASVLHALAPTIELGETNELNIARAYYLTAGCNIRLKNPFLSIHPSIMGRSDGIGYRADVTTRLHYTHEGRVLYVGLGYSPTISTTVFIGGNFNNIRVGYAYEIHTNAISVGSGNHELFVGYQMDLNLFKKGRNRHQSVRIL